MANGSSGGNGTPVDGSARGDGRHGLLRTLRREVGGVLAVPDSGRGWFLRAAASVRRAVSELEPSFVVSTGPPHSVHLATWLGMQGSGASWIADLRDPWAESARHHLDVAWWAPVMRRLEGRMARSASRVLTTTPHLSERLRERFPDLRAAPFPNGVDAEDLPRRVRGPRRVFSVVHLGTLYLHRDPAPVIRAFAGLVGEDSPPASSEPRLRFIGPTLGGLARRIETAAREEGIRDSVRLEPSRPRDEALRALAEAGVALVLAQNQRTQVPAKIYEAVAMGVPTVVVAERDSAAAYAGQRLGAAVHPPEDIEGMAASFRAAWTGAWDGRPPPGVKVDYADLAGELEELLLKP